MSIGETGWRLFGSAAEDSFDFSGLEALAAARSATAPAGTGGYGRSLAPPADFGDAGLAWGAGAAAAGLPDGGDPLRADRLAAEMARLADDAYKKSADAAVDRGWHALDAGDLGMARKGSGSVSYRFDDGVYRGKASGSSKGQALVLSRTLDDGDTVLAISFRGTVDLVRQFGDYFPFGRHYKSFKPLVAAVKDFVRDDDNGVDRVAVSGHSLGGAMAQLFMAEGLAVKTDGYTFGSPGASKPGRAKLVNFAHKNDLAPVLGEVKDHRAGGIVTVDKNGLGGIERPHSVERYAKTAAFLSGEARDPDSPFHAHGLARALRDGESYGGKVRLEIGTNKRDILKPFDNDRFALAGDGKDRFKLRDDELVAKRDRKFDGGEGHDKVLLPYKKTRKGDGEIFKVEERRDGSMVLKYDSKEGSKDHWKTVGAFYRTEKIVYANGRSESFDHAAAKTKAEDGDLLFA